MDEILKQAPGNRGESQHCDFEYQIDVGLLAGARAIQQLLAERDALHKRIATLEQELTFFDISLT